MTLITVNVGDRNTYDLTFIDRDTGDPIDLTTMTLRFTAKRRTSDDDDDAVILKTEDGGITVDADPTTGQATMVFEAEDTEDLEDLRSLHWDIQLDNGAGDIRTPMRGRLAFVRHVTHTRIGGS